MILDRLRFDVNLPKVIDAALEGDASAVDPALLKRYQSLVGALNYCATNTRPDIAYSVGYLCRVMILENGAEPVSVSTESRKWPIWPP